jgi:hypothetical protein
MKIISDNHLAEYSSNPFRMYWKAIEQARERSFKFLVSHKHGQYVKPILSILFIKIRL